MSIKQFLFFSLFSLTIASVNAQKVDSIYFHLYTDSLKKGTHNYINVDGKLSNGKWKPLTGKEISFSASYGIFEGNELILPSECTEEKVLVKAVLKDQPLIWKEVTVWIKIKPDDEKLPTKDEVIKGKKNSKNKPR